MSLFTYLHLHTHFSPGGGPASPEKWCRRAYELGYEAIGIADRAPMSGFPRFEVAAQGTGLTPLFGVELDLLLPGSSKSVPLVQPTLLFACNHTGLANLARVSSLSYGGWPGEEAGVPWERLPAHADGLVVILLGGDEAGAFSPVVSLAPKKRSEVGSLLSGCFGERAFIGIPHSGRPGDGALAGQVVRSAGEMNLPPVALPTARYLHSDDAPSYEALRLARHKAGWPREKGVTGPSTGSTTSDRPGSDFLRPPTEAAALFAEWPEAVANVTRIINLCSGARCLVRGTDHRRGEDMPSLAEIAERKLLDITGTAELSTARRKRLYAEVAASEQSGRVGSWLALASLRDIAANRPQDQASIPLGATLGIAEDSLLAYSLGLSSLDPTPHLPGSTPEQSPLPGVEVPASKRAALVSALIKEFGPDRIAHAACATDIIPATALSASATVLGVGKDAVRGLSANRDWPALKEFMAETQDQNLNRVAALALSLEGAPITFKPDYDTLLVAPRSVFGSSVIGDWMPVISPPGETAWVPWSEEALCKLRYPALSLQPSTVLSTLEAGLSLAARYPTPGFTSGKDLTAVPPIAEQTAQLFTEGNLTGIPYVCPTSPAALQEEITPESLSLLVARSLTSGLACAKEGIPAWEEATNDTGGLLIYKDQLDLLLSSLAGPDPNAVPTMREALRQRSDDARARFTATCEASGHDAECAEALWSALAKSAGLLPRSSAHAWGRIAFWSAMLKAHHSAALLAGALDAALEHGTHDEVPPLVEEAARLGVSVRPPDIDRGQARFGLERDGTGWAITWGLAHLPGWDTARAERLVGVRPAGGFSSFSQLLRLASRAGVTQAHIETLVRGGGCDHLGGTIRSRYALLEALPAAAARAPEGERVPTDMFSDASLSTAEEIISSNPPTSRERHLQRSWEMKHLGIGFTPAPEMENLHRALESSGDLKGRLLSSIQIGPDRVGQSVSLVGLLTSLALIKNESLHIADRNGNKDQPASDTTLPNTMPVAWLEDIEGSVELIAFPPNYNRHKEHWIENNLVIVTARVCTHENGDLYLLCEHIAPFYAEAVEEGFSIKVKVPARGALRKGAGKSAEGGPTSDGDKVAESVAPQTTPLRPSNTPQPAPVEANARESSSPTHSLVITLPEADNDNAAIGGMNALQRLLARHPGNDTVILHIPFSPETGSVTSAQLPYGVQHSRQLESEIIHLFGPASLAVTQPAPL